jgi:hypothetical protein
VSGDHWTIPNGTSAPGKVLPPAVVQVRVSTRDAKFRTGWLTMLEFLAAAGSLFLARGCWQSVRCPVSVSEQVPPGSPLTTGLMLLFEPPMGALGFGDALALGCWDALASGRWDALALGRCDALAPGLELALAWAAPVSMRVLAAVMTISAGQRPGRSFRFTVDLLGRSDVTTATRCRGR